MSGSLDRNNSAASFDFGMTDLEEQLTGEGGSDIRKQIAMHLAARAKGLREAIKTGLSPQEFEKAELALRGLAAAYDIIIRFPVTKTPAHAG